MKKFKLSMLMTTTIGVATLAAAAAGVGFGISQNKINTNDNVAPVKSTTAERPNPVQAGSYVIATFTNGGDQSISFIGNTAVKVLTGSPFGTVLAPTPVKASCHFSYWADAEGNKIEQNFIVNQNIEVHPIMQQDTGPLTIIGESKQFSTINADLDEDGEVTTTGDGCLDYHLWMNYGTSQAQEITDKSLVTWSVVDSEGKESKLASIKQTQMANQAFGTISTEFVGADMDFRSDVFVQATYAGDTTVSLPVAIEQPADIGLKKLATGEYVGENPIFFGEEIAGFPIWAQTVMSGKTTWSALDYNTVCYEPETDSNADGDITEYNWSTGTMIDSDVPRAEFDVDGIMMGRAFGTRTPYDTAGINDNFFRGCTALEPTYIRANYAPIVTIGDNFFASCTILDGFGDSTNKPMFFSSDGTNGTLCNLKSIGANFLADCTAFTGNSQFGISYFPHVGEIGDFFMINCTTYGSAATDVVKIDEVNKIGDHFMRNIGAKSVQIADDKIGYVGDGFLSNCQSLTSFDFACNPYIFVSAPTPDVPGGWTLLRQCLSTQKVAINISFAGDDAQYPDAVTHFIQRFPDVEFSQSETEHLFRKLQKAS